MKNSFVLFKSLITPESEYFGKIIGLKSNRYAIRRLDKFSPNSIYYRTENNIRFISDEDALFKYLELGLHDI